MNKPRSFLPAGQPFRSEHREICKITTGKLRNVAFLWPLVLVLALTSLSCKDTQRPADGDQTDTGTKICTPGQIFCSLGEARICRSDGISSDLFGDCLSFGGICVPGVGCDVAPVQDTGVDEHDTGVVLDSSIDDEDGTVSEQDTGHDTGPETICRAGERTCDGDRVKFCIGGREWADGADCTATEQRCKEGVCVGCTPGEKTCTGANTVSICEADGETMTVVGDCSEGRACHGGSCVGQCGGDNQKLSYMGCEYWAVDLENAAHPNTQFAVAVSNIHPQNNVTVKVTTATMGENNQLVETQVAEQLIEPGALKILQLPRTQQISGAIKALKTFRILADSPVIAYQFNPLNNSDETFSNDASLLLPSQTLDREYVAITGDATTGDYGANWGAYVAVVGISEYESNVRITMPPGVQFTAPAGTTVNGQVIEAKLGLYEVLTVTSTSVNTDVAGNGNISGAWITSDAAIAAFSGNVASIVPTGPKGTCCADHLETQLFPVATWGKDHVCGATYQRRRAAGAQIPDYWRIVAAEDNTTITYVPSRPAGAPELLNSGQSVEFSAVSSFIVKADKPVSMMQFIVSSYQAEPSVVYVNDLPPCSGETPAQNTYCTANAGYLANCTGFWNNEVWDYNYCCTPLGDPTMMPIPPVEQFRSDYIFLTPLDYQMDFVTIVAPSTAQVRLDGRLLDTGWVNIGMLGGKTWRSQALLLDSPGVRTLNSSEPVGMMVYGIDRDVSYGYAAGLDLDKIYSR